MRILLHLFLFHGLCFAAMGAPPAGHTTSYKAEVFVTGLTKPGTTSLGNTLELVNCIRSGWLGIWSQYLSHQALLLTSNLRSFTPRSEEYVVFELFTWCPLQVYTKMSRKSPDAKFILSLRRFGYRSERGEVFRYVRYCIRTFRSHIILVGNSHVWEKVRARQERSPYMRSPFQTAPKITETYRVREVIQVPFPKLYTVQAGLSMESKSRLHNLNHFNF
jgi:hypothetical protein